MTETLDDTAARSSPYTGTVLPQGRPFWIVDGKAYDFTEWMRIHPGGATWFGPSQGRDISALLHTYHRDPTRLRKVLASDDARAYRQFALVDAAGDHGQLGGDRVGLVAGLGRNRAGDLHRQPGQYRSHPGSGDGGGRGAVACVRAVPTSLMSVRARPDARKSP